eukprot:Rhum_TRINITY_DN9855_c0_g1::Rhum_TRINITY_DN9855_c0_g1_i1::g.35577::m.35577
MALLRRGLAGGRRLASHAVNELLSLETTASLATEFAENGVGSGAVRSVFERSGAMLGEPSASEAQRQTLRTLAVAYVTCGKFDAAAHVCGLCGLDLQAALRAAVYWEGGKHLTSGVAVLLLEKIAAPPKEVKLRLFGLLGAAHFKVALLLFKKHRHLAHKQHALLDHLVSIMRRPQHVKSFYVFVRGEEINLLRPEAGGRGEFGRRPRGSRADPSFLMGHVLRATREQQRDLLLRCAALNKHREDVDLHAVMAMLFTLEGCGTAAAPGPKEAAATAAAARIQRGDGATDGDDGAVLAEYAEHVRTLRLSEEQVAVVHAAFRWGDVTLESQPVPQPAAQATTEATAAPQDSVAEAAEILSRVQCEAGSVGELAAALWVPATPPLRFAPSFAVQPDLNVCRTKEEVAAALGTYVSVACATDGQLALACRLLSTLPGSYSSDSVASAFCGVAARVVQLSSAGVGAQLFIDSGYLSCLFVEEGSAAAKKAARLLQRRLLPVYEDVCAAAAPGPTLHACHFAAVKIIERGISDDATTHDKTPAARRLRPQARLPLLRTLAAVMDGVCAAAAASPPHKFAQAVEGLGRVWRGHNPDEMLRDIVADGAAAPGLVREAKDALLALQERKTRLAKAALAVVRRTAATGPRVACGIAAFAPERAALLVAWSVSGGHLRTLQDVCLALQACADSLAVAHAQAQLPAILQACRKEGIARISVPPPRLAATGDVKRLGDFINLLKQCSLSPIPEAVLRDVLDEVLARCAESPGSVTNAELVTLTWAICVARLTGYQRYIQALNALLCSRHKEGVEALSKSHVETLVRSVGHTGAGLPPLLVSLYPAEVRQTWLCSPRLLRSCPTQDNETTLWTTRL